MIKAGAGLGPGSRRTQQTQEHQHQHEGAHLAAHRIQLGWIHHDGDLGMG